MKNYDPVLSFGKEVAASYDDAPRGDERETVALLAELARGGPVFELAIGTGRIGLPLAATGVRVDGIDLSQAMVDRLREKPGGDRLQVTIGDFAAVPVDGTYPLIYIVFNTFFNLLTQDDQVRCFENVATHITEDGLFLIEAFDPSYLMRLRDNQYVDAEMIEIDEVRFDVGRHDPVKQILSESHVELTREGVRLFPIVCRYAWPGELDLMARLAGLRLHHRWGDWDRSAFTGASKRHISIYGR